MKHKKTFTRIVVLAVIIASLFASYHLGVMRSKATARTLICGTFVAELGALQDFRAKRETEGIDRLESHCYCWATILLGHPSSETEIAIKTFMPELVNYRDQFASDPAQWSVTEKRLEELLIENNWKESEHIGAP